VAVAWMRGRASGLYKCASVVNDMLFESQRGVALAVCVCACMPACVSACMPACMSACVSTCASACLCVGGSDSTEWEDITGSTQMTVVKGCVSFTSAVSARSLTYLVIALPLIHDVLIIIFLPCSVFLSSSIFYLSFFS